ncbi:MAG: hypothetical protein KME40_19840 [Komarekiella atlantica HA4396-MV6]|nr:hypothetical protein [Komarekiella atlantica HA4396-MV6]
MKNQEAWKFVIQVFFSTIVLGLCVFQIGSARDKENLALYWGGLSSVLAYWLPSPAGQLRDDKEQMTVNQKTFAAVNDGNGKGQGLAQVTNTTVTTEPQN